MVKKHQWWGRIASIDLYGCDPKLIKDFSVIRKYTAHLCRLIKMKRHGPTRIERFGDGALLGNSMMQFIKTSSITAHFDETENRAFIDVFSCKKFDPKTAADFSKKYFRAKSSKLRVLERK